MRKFPKPDRGQNLEATMIAFPSPNHDTHSTMGQTPDFHAGSAFANRFRNNDFDPTSPLRWDSDSPMRSPQSDVVLLHPSDSDSEETPVARQPPRVGTPEMQDMLNEFQDFRERNRPPPLALGDLFSRIIQREPNLSFPMHHAYTSDSYANLFARFQREMEQTINNIDIRINSYALQFDRNPPRLLEDETALSLEDYKYLSQIYNQLSISPHEEVHSMISQLEELVLNDGELIFQFEQILRDFENSSATSTLLSKIDELCRCREAVTGMSDALPRAMALKNRYTDLRRIITFTVLSLQGGKATVMLPHQGQFKEVHESVSLHSTVAGQNRDTDFKNELCEIMSVLPNTVFESSRVIAMFTKEGQRFQVAFPVGIGYPWKKIVPEVRVQMGSTKKITRMVESICKSCPFTRKPILQICQRISREFENL